MGTRKAQAENFIHNRILVQSIKCGESNLVEFFIFKVKISKIGLYRSITSKKPIFCRSFELIPLMLNPPEILRLKESLFKIILANEASAAASMPKIVPNFEQQRNKFTNLPIISMFNYKFELNT